MDDDFSGTEPSVLKLAIQERASGAATLLLEHRVNPNHQNNDRKTAIYELLNVLDSPSRATITVTRVKTFP